MVSRFLRVRKTVPALLVIAFAFLFQACVTKTIDIKTPDISSLPNGVYRGSYDSGLVAATVDAYIVDGRLAKVQVVKHRTGKGKPAEAIVDEVVAKQSLDVDAISGATRSSKVILKAIENALER